MNAEGRFVRGDVWSVDFGADPDGDTGLVAATAFQVEQVRAVSIARFVERLGRLDSVNRHAIDEILRNALSL